MMDALETVIFLVVVVNRLVAGLVQPLFDKYQIDAIWLMYASWLVGFIVIMLTGANLFEGMFPNEQVGQILSALVAGGGANLLTDLFNGLSKRKGKTNGIEPV